MWKCVKELGKQSETLAKWINVFFFLLSGFFVCYFFAKFLRYFSLYLFIFTFYFDFTLRINFVLSVCACVLLEICNFNVISQLFIWFIWLDECAHSALTTSDSIGGVAGVYTLKSRPCHTHILYVYKLGVVMSIRLTRFRQKVTKIFTDFHRIQKSETHVLLSHSTCTKTRSIIRILSICHT